MLKNRQTNKSHIVSRLFDTINKEVEHEVEVEHEEEEEEEHVGEEKEEHVEEENASDNESVLNNYVVSLPVFKRPVHFSNVKPMFICVYQVRTDGLYPFLLFLLQTPNGNEANFIEMPGPISGGYQKIKYASIAYAKTILPEIKISYAGFYELPDKNIIILNGTEQYSTEQPIEIYTSSDYIWTTSFEIINKRKLGTTFIHQTVLAFFFANLSFLTLKTLDERIYESPMIGYAKPRYDVCAIEELDIYRETLLPALGKSYYLFMDLPDFREKYIMRIVFFAGGMEVYKHEDNKKNYDSMLCGNYRRYLIQNYNQHTVLSVLSRPDKI